jgi:hypothetical protein
MRLYKTQPLPRAEISLSFFLAESKLRALAFYFPVRIQQMFLISKCTKELNLGLCTSWRMPPRNGDFQRILGSRNMQTWKPCDSGIHIYFDRVTDDSVRFCTTLRFWGTESGWLFFLCIFNCIFWNASFKLIEIWQLWFPESHDSSTRVLRNPPILLFTVKQFVILAAQRRENTENDKVETKSFVHVALFY